MKVYLLSIVIILLFLNGCAFTPKVHVPSLDEKIFSNEYICTTDWDGIPFEDAKENLNSWLRGLWNYDASHSQLQNCINTQATTQCYLLYALYNDLPELCAQFEPEYAVEYFNPPCASGACPGYYYFVSCDYRDICYTFVEIFNDN